MKKLDTIKPTRSALHRRSNSENIENISILNQNKILKDPGSLQWLQNTNDLNSSYLNIKSNTIKP